MGIADARSAVGWRQSQQRRVRCEGRDSREAFVSLRPQSSQGKVAAAHQTFSARDQVPHLRAQLAVGGPAIPSGVGTDENRRDVSMAGALANAVDGLQRAQMQERST